jgi:hypothetical protein
MEVVKTSASDTAASVTLQYSFDGSDPGYPFALNVQITYTLDVHGFSFAVTATNLNKEGWPLPFYNGGQSCRARSPARWTLLIPSLSSAALPTAIGPHTLTVEDGCGMQDGTRTFCAKIRPRSLSPWTTARIGCTSKLQQGRSIRHRATRTWCQQDRRPHSLASTAQSLSAGTRVCQLTLMSRPKPQQDALGITRLRCSTQSLGMCFGCLPRAFHFCRSGPERNPHLG